ncbi:hypothetical protein [Mesorhizobium sp. Mes31]|uniref:hypothetical protein n=1 Tax=Mesorhizobium sp. Mes31 TaxID=2926017 RepID=UPI002119281B|nr:hypothetical protein [Mesorhizobium sp. Mes31]
MVTYQTEPSSSTSGLAGAMLTLAIGLVMTFAAGLWVSQIPQTRGELISELAETNGVIESLTTQVQQANAQTDEIIASLTTVSKQIQDSTVDEKTKNALLGSLNEASAKLLGMRSGSDLVLQRFDLTSIETPRFSLISQAEAAPRKKAPKQLPDPWYFRPAYRIYIVGALGLFAGGIFLVLYVISKDATKLKFYQTCLKGIGTFLGGLASGGVLVS